MSTDTEVVDKEKIKNKDPKEPGKYKVVVLNDDHTPMEFVVAMLVSVFRHDEKSAVNLTLKIHETGSAVVGIYAYEIAEQKVIDGTNLARRNGFPLVLKAEAE